jgi:hypothetical protein
MFYHLIRYVACYISPAKLITKIHHVVGSVTACGKSALHTRRRRRRRRFALVLGMLRAGNLAEQSHKGVATIHGGIYLLIEQ